MAYFGPQYQSIYHINSLDLLMPLTLDANMNNTCDVFLIFGIFLKFIHIINFGIHILCQRYFQLFTGKTYPQLYNSRLSIDFVYALCAAILILMPFHSLYCSGSFQTPKFIKICTSLDRQYPENLLGSQY